LFLASEYTKSNNITFIKSEVTTGCKELSGGKLRLSGGGNERHTPCRYRVRVRVRVGERVQVEVGGALFKVLGLRSLGGGL